MVPNRYPHENLNSQECNLHPILLYLKYVKHEQLQSEHYQSEHSAFSNTEVMAEKLWEGTAGRLQVGRCAYSTAPPSQNNGTLLWQTIGHERHTCAVFRRWVWFLVWAVENPMKQPLELQDYAHRASASIVSTTESLRQPLPKTLLHSEATGTMMRPELDH